MSDKLPPAKQVLVIRKDLNMRKGKLAAQACHASLSAYVNAQMRSDNRWVVRWRGNNYAKIVVSVAGEGALLEAHAQALQKSIPHALIKDAGLTEFSEPTLTALGLGPFWSDVIDEVTGNLPLL